MISAAPSLCLHSEDFMPMEKHDNFIISPTEILVEAGILKKGRSI